MTKDELKGYIDTLTSLGDLLKQFLPGQIDDRVVEYIRAIGASDALLTLMADDLTPGFQAAMADAPQGDMVLLASDGSEVARLTPEIWMFLITTLLPMLLEWFKNRRNQGVA